MLSFISLHCKEVPLSHYRFSLQTRGYCHFFCFNMRDSKGKVCTRHDYLLPIYFDSVLVIAVVVVVVVVIISPHKQTCTLHVLLRLFVPYFS